LHSLVGAAERMNGLIENAERGRRKFASYAEQFGVGGAIRQVWRNVFLIETMCRLDKDLQVMEDKVEPKIPLVVKPYSKIDFDGWRDRPAILAIRGDYGLIQFKERFERGNIFFAAYSGDYFVGFVWLEFPPVIGAGYPLSDHEAYTYDGWTFEAYRGNRILPVIQQSIMDYVRMTRTDIQFLVTHVAARNQPSLSGDLRAGYRVGRKELALVFLGYHRKVRIFGS
jgi:hypothetical protein